MTQRQLSQPVSNPAREKPNHFSDGYHLRSESVGPVPLTASRVTFTLRKPPGRAAMTNVLQLNPPLWLETPKGMALCHLVLDYGVEHALQWVCFLQDTGECWTFDNTEIRAPKNITMGRRVTEKAA